MVNFIIGRELGGNFAIEGGYVGRFGRDLLIRRDLAMPLNLVDTRPGMDYFTAAQQLIRAMQAAGIPRGLRRSTRTPSIAEHSVLGEPVPEPRAIRRRCRRRRQFARRFNNDAPDYITTLWRADQFCSPGVQHLRAVRLLRRSSTTRSRR